MSKDLINNTLTYNPNSSVLHSGFWDKKLRYFSGHFNGNSSLKILDIGGRSRFTNVLQSLTTIEIQNTDGDLDDGFTFRDEEKYDVVVYSHTMEHQFNPLYTLLRLKESPATRDAIIFISLPSRGKLLWTPHHFHEIDDYRFRLLCERAGLEILNVHRGKEWRVWTFYLKGIRPLLRLFFEYSIDYKCKFK
jgi:hypothetical protein